MNTESNEMMDNENHKIVNDIVESLIRKMEKVHNKFYPKMQPEQAFDISLSVIPNTLSNWIYFMFRESRITNDGNVDEKETRNLFLKVKLELEKRLLYMLDITFARIEKEAFKNETH